MDNVIASLLEGVASGDMKAIREYAYKLYKGEEVEKDVKEAYRLFAQAAEHDDTNAMFWLGAICENEKECLSLQEGFEWFLKAAKLGDIAAQFQIGYHYLHGVTVQQDYYQAFKWFMISAMHGYPNSQNSLGTMYLRGQVKLDEWDKKNNPNPTDSTHDLGFYQRTGWRWLMKSASQKHPSGLYNLAGMYLYGVYVEKDFDLAISMYRLANKIGGTGTRSMDILNKLKVDSEFSEIDYKRLELFFSEWDDLETEYSFHSVELNDDYSDLAEEDEIQIISEKTEEYKKSKIKYLLFDRHVIGKYDDDVYVRDLKNHLWEYSHDYTCDYLYENDCVVEEIDYDESNEEIRGLRRAKGHWYCEDAVTACKPSPQVITYLEKTGLKYVDLYGAYGNEEADQQETNTESLFRRFPDLLEGAPGFENWKEKNIN